MGGETAVAQRVVRVCQKAGITGDNYTVHLDRGYTSMAAVEALSAVGVNVNACTSANRVGLPREAMALAITNMTQPLPQHVGGLSEVLSGLADPPL